MGSMELVTRLVFVDTSSFESKNFQFGQHSLGILEELIKDKKVRLLTTEITLKEITSHLKKHSVDAAKTIKKIQKDAMFLRNTEELPCHGIFDKVSADTIYEIVKAKFDTFLDTENVEIVSISGVDSNIVFDKYFNAIAPFNSANKKNEFPDAFVLEAINELSKQRNHPVYIISSDGDMKSYASLHDNLHYLSRVDDLIDLVVRYSEEPLDFADSIFNDLTDTIIETVKSNILDSEIYSEELVEYDDEIANVTINDICIKHKNLLAVNDDEAEYEVEFAVDLTVEYLIADYERSAWDPEDKAYKFLLYNRLVKQYNEIFSANIQLSYVDSIRSNAEISELDFDGNLQLRTENGGEVSFEYLDINHE